MSSSICIIAFIAIFANITAVSAQVTEAEGSGDGGEDMFTLSTLLVEIIDEVVTPLMTSDIRVVSLTPSAAVEYYFDQDNTVSFSVQIENIGIIDIPAANSGGHNYKFSFYASSDNDPTEADRKIMNLTYQDVGNNSLSVGLDSDTNKTFSGFQLVVNIPAADCTDYSYICVHVEMGSDVYDNDPNGNNNHACLQFGPFVEGLAGVYQCADIQVLGLGVTYLESGTIDFKVDNIVTYTVTLRNAGPFDIQATSSGNNFHLSFMLSNTTEPSSNNAAVVSYVVETSRSEDLIIAVPSSTYRAISNIDVNVRIPDTVCEDYQYMCVKVTKANGTTFTDNDLTNNDYCILFGDITEGYAGQLPCKGCLTRTSLLLLVAAAFVQFSL